ncbi:MAG TPA: carbohydrate kinase [Gammaproteobacteria bacterium]|nr:carbohydrate kinase [Gammaproteobacteria bacterium]
MAELVCFGEALIDFLGEPDTGTGALCYRRYAGGAPANVAVAAARLGTATAFVGMFGQDAFGDFLLESLVTAGVDTRYAVRTDEANTALAFVSLDPTGDRRFSFYRPPAADLLFRPGHFKPECFAQARFFHVCSNSLTEADIAATTLEGVRRARQAGALVSFDINLRPKLWHPETDPAPRIWSVLKEADVVKASAAELRFLIQGLGSEQQVLAELWRGRAQWLLITDGSAPARQFTRRGEDILPIFPVQAVNTTGAGDAFMGGLLSRLVLEKVEAANLDGFLADAGRMQRVLRFASACGALSVQRHGAFEAMPTLPEVEAFLERQP